MLSWVRIGIGGVLGAAVMFTVLGAYNILWENPTVRAEERDRIEAEARTRAMALIAKRSADNEEISAFDKSQLCGELGGRWVPNEDRCD